MIEKMKFCKIAMNNVVYSGVIYKDMIQYIPDSKAQLINDKNFKEYVRIGKFNEISERIEYLPPIFPGKIICVGFNYKMHKEDLPGIATKNPTLTLKAHGSIVGHKHDIMVPDAPEISQDIQYEPELGIVIKMKGFMIKKPEEHILGYTIVNDVTARGVEQEMVQWSASKSLPTFCPVGPFVISADEADPGNMDIVCRINGKEVGKANTGSMIYSAHECVKFVSRFMRLDPFDLICTGAPMTGNLSNRDVIDITIDDIGTLSNRVVFTNSDENTSGEVE